VRLLVPVVPSYLCNIGDIAMPPSTENIHFDPEMIDLLIKKEKEELEDAQERPFLQIPILNAPNIEKPPIKEEKESVIVLDL